MVKMSLIDDIKGLEQTITAYMEKMDSIKNQFRSHMKSLQATGMIDSRKTEEKPNTSDDTDRNEIETPKVNRKQVQQQSPQCSDDDFRCGPVSKKPKKPLCLSIKKSAKNRPKCAKDKRLEDVAVSEEQKIPKSQGNGEDKTRISISWTIKIKESSAQQTNQVSITGTEKIDWAGMDNTLSDTKQCNFDELKVQQSLSSPEDGSTNRLSEIAGTVETSNDESESRGVNEHEHQRLEECRVVVRKLSTSSKIFQPKVVRQQLTDEEIDRICGSDQKAADQVNSSAVKPRYTSLILEPPRISPRVFSTVKMRCSVTRLVLTPLPMIKPKSEMKKSMPEQGCSEMVKSMFKRSKCVQEWRGRARTKDPRQCAPNARKLLDSKERPIQSNTLQPCPGNNRSKCPKAKERNSEAKGDERKIELDSPTIDTSAATFGKSGDKPMNITILMKSKDIEKPIPTSENLDKTDSRSDFQKNPADKNGRYSIEFEKLEVKKESNLGKITEEAKSKIHSVNPRNSKGAGAVSKYQPNSIQGPEKSEITKPSVDGSKTVPRKGAACTTFRGRRTKSPQNGVSTTPTRLKYTVKTRNIPNDTPIYSGRVTRSRIKIQHAPTDSGSRPKNGNTFPGSQLTFLIESFRR